MDRLQADFAPLDAMRQLYELFPYPNRPLLMQPQPLAHLTSHGGFAALLVHGRYREAQRVAEHSSRTQATTSRLRQAETELNFLQSAEVFGPDKRILLVGCGTDEPLLFHLLHPTHEVVGVDLSKKNIAIAQRKLKLSRTRDKVRHLFRWLPWAKECLPKRAPVLLHGHAETILAEPSVGNFDFIQCFGVLHHQPHPQVLLEAMAARLSPQGALRIMIYSYHGRALERKIQQRYHHLWAHGAKRRYRGAAKAKLVMRFQLLRCWQLLNFTGVLPSTRRRFRYLGLQRAAVADALMHPSDPGLPLEGLLGLAHKAGLELAYCEGKVYGQGLLEGYENPKRTWHELVKADKRHDLMTNPLVIFKKRAP